MARPRSDISDRIVRAAFDRFLREGVDGASLRTIASDAETSIGMIYYYFPTKDDLFLAVVDRIYDALSADLVAALDPSQPVETRIRALYARAGSFSAEEHKFLRLVLRESLLSSQRMERVLTRTVDGHLPLVAQLVLDARRDGLIAPDQSLVGAMMVLFSVGFMPQVLRGRLASLPIAEGIPSGEELAKTAGDILLNGLVPREKRE